ncbi:unnamed protein product [Brassica oleracea var. botrytis]|uniref:Uncharacterized protein n=2 Tax=Brassica TaxID=3705 RepID=A0A3P6FQI1_BRAOL|nr:unnamed protein product [Brassica napus]CDY17554.1 BnaC01g26780D [Brassica napus]VDD51036.1 unnamed protein product [Brassica oleracea]
MRDSKRVEGETPVELRTESRKAGTAIEGTCLKLIDSEVITEAASQPEIDIRKTSILRLFGIRVTE